MMEKIKQMLTVAASVTAMLYGTGYIAEFSHSRMLGISMVEPDNVYYLISGGTVYFKSIIAVYLSLVGPRAFIFILMIIVTVCLLFYENKLGTRNMKRLPKTYVISMFLLIVFLLVFAIPFFSSSMHIKKLLPPAPDSKPKKTETLNYIERTAAELSSWVRNEDEAGVNKQKLYDFYVASLLTSIFSGIFLFSALRRRRCWKPIPPPLPGEKQSFLEKIFNFANTFKHPLYFFALILLTAAVAVQILVIPLNYGVLVQSNHYPSIAITMEKDSESLIYGAKDKYWLLRQNKDLFLIYALVAVKGEELPEYKLFTLKKKDVKKIDIIDIKSIFAYN
jgi:hypothetical protein